MSTKFVRFFAALAVMVSIFGNSGVVRADHGAAPGVGVQNLNLPRAPQPHPLDRQALTISPPSSLGSQFVHIATAANSVSDYTIINNSLTNGNPSAILIVTPNWNPGGVGGTFDNHPIGVYYVGGKWTIFNQDITPIPVGAAFNVIIPTSGAGVFVQTVTPANIGGEVTFIDNALINANPNAIMLVTPNYNPGGGCGCIYDNHPIGVYYSTASGNQWGIFNQDNVAMPLNASFNVFVLAAGADVFVHTATAGNSAGDYTTIDDALTNRNPNAIVFVTQNANPGSAVAYNNHNIGVYYNSAANRWRIFNQDNISAVTANTSFNVLVLASDIFVHRATAGNSSGNVTLIDNVLTNSNPNAIVFTTPNYNPSGAGGTYNNHNIGVIYRILENQIAIFNQDAVAMPTTAAFNVLIPNPDTSVFVQKATVSNITSNWTTIDYPLTNGKPNAIVLVTPNWNPSGVGATFDNHPIGVSYDGSKWNIFNQDLAAMPVNASFNVTVPTAGTGTGVFVHTATAPNISGNWTAIDYPLTNGNPNAIIIATPNYNPGGAGGIYDDHPIGVWYNGSKWSIFNQDLAAMPVNASFNLYVVGNYKLYLPLIFR
jgi:hypothetical protein